MTGEYTNNNKTEIKRTGDGSDTLISKAFDQPYHSLGGAVAESQYVYFESTGLDQALSNGTDLNILEIGFGTGMNLVLLLDYLQKSKYTSTVNFFSVEAFPVDPETASKIDFGDSLSHLDYNQMLSDIFTDLSPGVNRFDIRPNLTLYLFVDTFEEFSQLPYSKIGSAYPNELRIDYVLHDPFSPDSNPAGWTPELFSAFTKVCNPDAMLSTYSAATSARAAMASAGWSIARAPGALGKREMTVASKNPDKLSHLKRVNESRLIERFKAGDFDI